MINPDVKKFWSSVPVRLSSDRPPNLTMQARRPAGLSARKASKSFW